MLLNWLKYRYCKAFNEPHMRLVMLQVTERCNNKCKMCSIWNIKNPREMPLEHIERFFEKSNLKKMISFCLMGGETYLYKDLIGATKLVKKYHPDVNLFTSSNCYAVDHTVKTAMELNNIMKVDFCASLDGDDKTHNEIRGVPESSQHVKQVIKLLKGHGIKPFISFTIIPDNFDQIVKIHSLAKSMGIDFSCRPAATGTYFNNEDKSFALNDGQKQRVYDQLKEINYADHFLLVGVEKFLKGKRMFPCGGGYFSCYIDLDENVYPCTHCPKEWSMGNLKDFDYDLEKLLKSKKAKEVRRNKVDKCNACINDVEYCATYAMEQFKLISWILGRMSLKGKFTPKWAIEQVFKR